MFADSHNNLGVVLQSSGKHEAALAAFRKALTIKPEYALALSNMGASLAALERLGEAEQAYRHALALDPVNAIALGNFGAILMRCGKAVEAEGALTQALVLQPDFILAKVCLGEILLSGGREAPALPLWAELVEAQPDVPAHRMAFAAALRACERPQEAKAQLEIAHSLDPALPDAIFRLGRMEEELGDLDRARELFRRAIEIRPAHFVYHASLVNVAKLSQNDPVFQEMEKACSSDDPLELQEKINLFFAFGKALDVVKRHEESFDVICRANALRRSATIYDERRALEGLRAIRRAYSAPVARGTGVYTVPGDPIFIVGMPRSGSTLVDQMLTSHSEVASVGESRALPEAIREFRNDNPDWQFPRNALEMTEAQCGAIHHNYTRITGKIAVQLTGKTSPRAICDKLLSNFRYLGLILNVFPNAKIIHTCRNPIDSCLSTFGINFADQAFTYDLGEIGRYYREYALMMQHWHKVLPVDAILDVRYEDVVADTEGSARRILDFCGLEWDDACLRFHETDRPVRTASVAQVRQPIYQSSARKWQPSKEKLEPLLKGLGLQSASP